MPRQDVPYGGAICRLKERIAEIWDELGEKLHSINGVEGDGAGNVEIVSGDAAITVSESPTGHFIEIGLDHGNLPSAAVSSVNGQTGAVRLDAADIPSEEHSNVQTDLDTNKAAINDCFDSITSEQLARQNADATLQTNINAVSASIPEMSATPDPYKGVERDAQGRAFAADPESGATDKTLVTANWVSQTGDSGPNNLVHRSGNETILGEKSFETIQSPNTIQRNKYASENNKWCKMLTFPTGTSRNYIFVFHSAEGAWPSFGMLQVENDYGGFPRAYWITRRYNNQINSTFNTADSVAITRGLTDGRYDLWIKGSKVIVNGGAFIATLGTKTINDINYPSVKEYVDDITQVGATDIYYAQDYPFGV